MRPVNILLIEDNPGDIELVRTGFADARMVNVLQVISDGQEAVDFFIRGQQLPDIILLDINLPKVDGFEVLQQIRQQPASRNLPVIVLTSSAADADISRSYAEAANCYITKPVDFEKFLEAIHSLEEFWLTVVQLPGDVEMDIA